MSGFFGILRLDDRPVAAAELQPMLDILAHRGPDGAQLWHEGCVGLGHRMLHTTPESMRERLPLHDQERGLAITADARIDNRAELAEQLGITSERAVALADSQLILAAYAQWWKGCPEKLIGDFAFTIWDSRAQKLFGARDPMGVKPFFLCHQPGKLLAFASEIKAILTLSEVPRQVNEMRIAEYLALRFEDRRATAYVGIECLPAAHALVVDRSGCRDWQYWHLDPTREIKLSSDQEYAEAFREVFRTAVDCRLRSAFPVGSTLSGGLDSSSIACMARDQLRKAEREPLHSFSAIFPGVPEKHRKLCDEREFQDAVVAMGGVAHHAVRVDDRSPLGDIDRVLWQTEEGLIVVNGYLHRALFGTAQSAGVRVMLDGMDGDTTVSHGFENMTELFRTLRWLEFAREVSAYSDRYGTPQRWLIRNYGLRPLAPTWAVKAWRTLRRRPPQDPCGDTSLLAKAFADRIGLADHCRALRNGGGPTARTGREIHIAGVRMPFYQTTLQVVDRYVAPFALEVRYPFWDRRLIEFCVALPGEQKLHRGWTRVVMRRAMEGVLPSTVQWRLHKGNLSPSGRYGLLAFERPLLEEIMQGKIGGLSNYVNMDRLRLLYSQYVKNPMGLDGQDLVRMFHALVAALWLQSENQQSLASDRSKLG